MLLATIFLSGNFQFLVPGGPVVANRSNTVGTRDHSAGLPEERHSERSQGPRSAHLIKLDVSQYDMVAIAGARLCLFDTPAVDLAHAVKICLAVPASAQSWIFFAGVATATSLRCV